MSPSRPRRPILRTRTATRLAERHRDNLRLAARPIWYRAIPPGARAARRPWFDRRA